MLKASCLLLVCLLLTLSSLSLALGQEMRTDQFPGETQIIIASTTAERVRISAPSAVVQLRLEVYDEAGQKLFDTEQHGGNVLDWHLQGSNGQRVADGSYLCVVTSKNLTGRFSQKMGMVTVSDRGAQMRATAVKELSLRQTQTVGPIEEGDEGLAVIGAADTQPVTVVTHTGQEAELTRTRGALSFRLGDFFSGSDKEQMRLTEEGNLGIGTAKPKVKLDVAGTVRAREGFQFADGSNLNVNDKGALTLTNSNGTTSANVSGTGTQNRLAKWTDNGGTLGDSIAVDTGTGLQLTAAPNISADTNLLYLNSTNGTTGVLAGSTPSYGANNGPFFAMRGNTYSTIAGQRGLFTIAAGNITSPAGDDGSIKFNTGNDLLRMVIRPSGDVGVGVSSPNAKLDVGGDINTSTGYNIGGPRVLSVAGDNLFAGVGAGQDNTGGSNSFFGTAAGRRNTSGSQNSFFGWGAGAFSTTGDNNVYIGYGTAFNAQGDSNNTLIGSFADIGGLGNSNATAIGFRAQVTQNDSLVFGSINGQNNATSDTNVGIGTTAPARRLHVKGAGSDGTGQTDVRITGTGSIGSGITLQSTGTAGRTYSLLSTADNTGGGGFPGGRFGIFDVNGGAYRMVIDASGNVGIGATSPVNRLTVAGAADFSGNVGIGTNAPNARLHVSGGDIAITTQNTGLILRATNGPNCYRLTVDVTGILSTALVACP